MFTAGAGDLKNFWKKQYQIFVEQNIILTF